VSRLEREIYIARHRVANNQAGLTWLLSIVANKPYRYPCARSRPKLWSDPLSIEA
jgi:hypothetical protein